MNTPKIGRYELQREIDRGGMAVVYLARDPQLSRAVAIKILPKEFMFSPKFRARFQREAKVLVSLQHPGIVPVYDFGEHEGQPYLVMRYMSGGSLIQQIQEGALSLTETAAIIDRIAPALDEAHSHGMIHRDLKPANVLFDEDNQAYLADFGVVKMTEDHSMTLTTQGGVVGTPAYMSPEQVMGSDKLDGRSDIYALGAILYQMLTGRVPYDSDTPMGQAMMHVVKPLPNILDARKDLPPETQEIIAKAMAKEKEERYPTATALAKAVNDLAAKSGPAAVVKPKAPKERRKLPLTLIGGILIAILCIVAAGAGAVFFIASGDNEEPTRTPTAEVATDTPVIDSEPIETIGAPATAAIILPGNQSATEASIDTTAGSPGLLPTLRSTSTPITPSPVSTRAFVPTASFTDTPPPPPPQQPTNPPPPPPSNTPEPQPPTDTPEPAPPTNTPPPIHTQSVPT